MARMPVVKKVQELNQIQSNIGTGSNKTFTLSNGYRGILFGITATESKCFMIYLMASSSAGATSTVDINKGSNITFDTATANKLKITVSGSGSAAVYIYDLTFEGTISE